MLETCYQLSNWKQFNKIKVKTQIMIELVLIKWLLLHNAFDKRSIFCKDTFAFTHLIQCSVHDLLQSVLMSELNIKIMLSKFNVSIRIIIIYKSVEEMNYVQRISSSNSESQKAKKVEQLSWDHNFLMQTCLPSKLSTRHWIL